MSIPSDTPSDTSTYDIEPFQSKGGRGAYDGNFYFRVRRLGSLSANRTVAINIAQFLMHKSKQNAYE